MTLLVSGIPKWTCKPRDIEHMFNSVAQVRCVEINQDQGFAKVKLFDENSSSLVADEEWCINSSRLYVTTNQFSMKRKKGSTNVRTNVTSITSQKDAGKTNSDSHYQIYKRTANSFWLDVPHHKAKIKRKPLKSKHKMQIPKKGSNTDCMVNRTKEEKQRHRKKRKLSKEKNSLVPNNRTSLKLEEFITHVDIVMKEICGLEKTDKTNDFKKAVTLKCKDDCTKEIGTNEACSSAAHSPVNLEMTSGLLPEIPVCVYFKGKMTVMNVCPVSSSEDEIKEKVRVNFGVPGKLQLLLCNGKVFGPDCLHRLRPYDNIDVIIRGKGGMQSSQLDISISSTETDVEVWLKEEVGLNDDILEKYSILSELNGQTLFSYDVENIDVFKSDTDIPIGIARKILAFRDKTFDGISNPLLRFTSKDISEFMERTLNAKDRSVEQLFKEIIERHIDGYVFYSYKDEKQFQRDFTDLNLKGLYFRKVIIKRNSDFKIETEGKCQTTFPISEDETISGLAPSQPIQEKQPGTQYASDSIKYPAQKSLSYNPDNPHQHVQESLSCNPDNPYQRVLCSLLSLNEIGDGDNYPCQIKIIHGSWTNMNELEKNFIFFLICGKKEYTEKNQQRGLWNKICNNLKQWFELLSPKKKELFTEGGQCGVYLFNKKKVQLSKPCKLVFPMEKGCASILNFDIPIILVSRSIFHTHHNAYVACLSRNLKEPEKLHFSFKPSAKYFIFDPEDYDKGFVEEKISDMDCWQQMFSTTSFHETENKDVTAPTNNTVDKLTEMEEFDVKEEKNSQDEDVLLYIKDEKCDETKSTQIECNENHEIKIQVPREFKEEPDHVIYHAGRTFSQPENDGTLSLRCLEFKSFLTCVKKAKETRLIKFQTEVLRFACGCLNARKNGTIYFGVADSVQNEDFKHGEIVGFEISETGNDSRTKYTDALRDGIKRCFDNDTFSAAEKCISNPKFIKIVIPGEKIFRYIMEVDVEPLSCFCKDLHFKVNLKIINSTIKLVENKYILFVRKGSSTQKFLNEQEQLFIKIELPEIVKQRIDFDGQKNRQIMFSTEEPATKLERLLTRGNFKFDKRLWPILVLSKPSDGQKMNEKWTKSTYFIKTIQFMAVFDFDDGSNKNDLCSLHTNSERFTLLTEEIFHKNGGNLHELATKLGIPFNVKTRWIFANGRMDFQRPHLNRSGWHESYSAGVSVAVHFFSQNFVIPEGRAVILVLLFSNEYDGIIDTFNEITRNFGWGPIVIVAEHKRIFDEFAEIIEHEGKGSREQLEKVSVLGMPWEHVNSTIISLTGYDERINCVLPSSSGAFVNADEKFLDTLADLSVLGAKQCENKKFDNDQVRKQFAREHEMLFYKGNNVSWWNFYFDNHVCRRHRYETLQQTIRTLLLPVSEETRKVVTFKIAHEPGAGATTLGHHLLWDLRRSYRCCVVKRLSEMTKMQVLSLWKYKEDGLNEIRPKPIVLLLDDIDQNELTVPEFTRQLNVEFRREEMRFGVNCIVVICQREEKLGYNNDSQTMFYLKQELIEKERQWFRDKLNELEQTRRELDLEEFNPQHLISFMIMREGFNLDYIKTTIKHFISTIDPSSNEYKLLKYVSFLATYTPISRRGVKCYVPLECCDELMGGKNRFWEDSLSGSLKVLLVIEEKEEASGRKVRIAHPSLGEIIFNEILKNEKTQLCNVALEFLNCPLLQSNTYGKNILVEFTLDMLKRRKTEEYDDEKKTKFSPLIEKIMEISQNYEKAVEILQLGFDNFHDERLAQALARLYLKWEKYDEAILWAEKAVDFSGQTAASYIRHTHGFVLLEKFKNLTAKKTFHPPDVLEHLQLILESLDVFLRAARDNDDETDTQNLVCLYDAIRTINEITKFLRENILYAMDKKDIVRYLKDKEYIPDEIDKIWAKFHERLKRMREQASYAFNVLEDNVCFITTFYAAEEVSLNVTHKTREHRFYKCFQFGHGKLLDNFSRIYGEPDPPDDCASQLENDVYHRGKLWTLKGNSYMNIFNHLKYSRTTNNIEKISAQLCEIRQHITQIKSKDSNDLANEVCVNIALGIIGYPNPDSESKIFTTCQQIIDIGSEKVVLAYFFISMLLWPCGTRRKSFYNDSLLQKSLSHLKRNFKPQNNDQSVHGRNVSQPTPQFFLAKGNGLKSICHRCQVPGFVRENPRSRFDDALWNEPETIGKLRSLHGIITTVKDSSRNIITFNHEHGEPIKISKIRGINNGFFLDQAVSFYLGFSIAGPIAYNVKLKCHANANKQVFNDPELYVSSRVDDYEKYSAKQLREMLIQIKRLEGKKPDCLSDKERKLLNEKDDIKETLDRHEINSEEADFTALIDID